MTKLGPRPAHKCALAMRKIENFLQEILELSFWWPAMAHYNFYLIPSTETFWIKKLFISTEEEEAAADSEMKSN